MYGCQQVLISPKNGANMGKVGNQRFVQIPTGKLKDRIAQLCEQYGIQFVETEESYTSQSSFLDGDELPTFGENPKGGSHQESEQRVGLEQQTVSLSTRTATEQQT